MRVRALDSNMDWTFGQGTSNYKLNRDAVTQNIQTRLQMFANDCFFSLSGWIDWLNLLGGKNEEILKLFITNLILNTTYVSQITSLSLSVSGRAMTVNYTVETSYGVVSASGVPIGVPTQYLLTQSGDILTTQSGDGIII